MFNENKSTRGLAGWHMEGVWGPRRAVNNPVAEYRMSKERCIGAVSCLAVSDSLDWPSQGLGELSS